MAGAPMSEYGMRVETADASESTFDASEFWWMWLVVGIAWVIAALVILQFDQASVKTIGVIVGIMFR